MQTRAKSQGTSLTLPLFVVPQTQKVTQAQDIFKRPHSDANRYSLCLSPQISVNPYEHLLVDFVGRVLVVSLTVLAPTNLPSLFLVVPLAAPMVWRWVSHLLQSFSLC